MAEEVSKGVENLTVEDSTTSTTEGSPSAVEYKPSAAASANVGEILATDASDESLRRYKEQLLGAAAKGDLGDVNDPRKLIVVEFRVQFQEGEGQQDVVFNLDTPEGVEKMKSTGLLLKEGCHYKFHLSFRVQHEILSGLKFVNKMKRAMLSTSDEIVIGSYAPQSQLHVFEYPRRGYNEAPTGMMSRGKYTAEDRFVDSDGVTHLEYTYPVTIAKTWSG